VADDRIAVFHAQGTSYLFNLGGILIEMPSEGPLLVNGELGRQVTVAGIDGRNATWDLTPPNDPFPWMLDPAIFDAKKVAYSASLAPGNVSIDTGINELKKLMSKLKPGQPFCLVGYSQGAGVCSEAWRHGLQPGSSGWAAQYRDQFLGGCMFGNPRRALNHRGEVGGTWSGSWDVPGSNSGGHGVFPTTDAAFPRLTSCEGYWVELTAPDDIFSSVGDSTKGVYFSEASDDLLMVGRGGVLGFLAGLGPKLDAANEAMFGDDAVGKQLNYFLDADDNYFHVGGNGHMAYAFMPPPNSDGSYNETITVIGGHTYRKAVGDTMYQTALKYLTGLAAQYAVSGSVLPPTPTAPSAAGWSTTLIPPAA